MRALLTPSILALLTTTALAATTVPSREPDRKLEGKLENGKVIDNGWASQSNVACFPANMGSYFSGNQVFFTMPQPTDKDIVVRVTPESGVDVSVYALQLGPTQHGARPPGISAAWRCTPAYSKKASGEESLRLTTNGSDIEVVLAVVGASGAATGAFTVDIWEEPGRF